MISLARKVRITRNRCFEGKVDRMNKFKSWLRKKILFCKLKKIAKEIYELQRRIQRKNLE